MPRRGFTIYRKHPRGSWYVAWTDGQGRRRTIKASADKKIAEEIGRAKAAEADRVRAGVLDAAELSEKNNANLAIGVHLDAWRDSLKAQQRTVKYANMERTRVAALFEAVGIGCLLDLKREKIEKALDLISKKHTAQTAAHYRTAVRMFSRWCAESDRTASDKLYHLEPIAAHGKTFRRTRLTAAQVSALIDAAETRKCRSPFKGPDRAMYYRLMAYTGFRRSEAASLTPESFDLSGKVPAVTVQAAYSKHRREDVQILSPDFAAMLRTWLVGKPAKQPVFNVGKGFRFEDVFRLDCEAAGIKKGDGEVLGMHSLRRFYISSVVRAAGLAVGQELARHSTPKLTAEYTDLELRDLRKGLAGLPPVRAKQERRKIG